MGADRAPLDHKTASGLRKSDAHLIEQELFARLLAERIVHKVRLAEIAEAHPSIDRTAENWLFQLADAVADRVAATVPRTSEVDQLIGPFYRAADLALWKGVTRQAISKQARQRRLLALHSSSGSVLYPAWQFDLTGVGLPHLAEVLNLIDPDNRDPLGSALWLHRSAERFDTLTPAEALRAGRISEVRAAAGQIASGDTA